MRQAPLLLPAIAFVAGILAQAHGFTRAAFALAAIGMPLAPALAGAALAGVADGWLRGHPDVVTAERPTGRYWGTVVGDIEPAADGSAVSFALAIDGVGTLRALGRVQVAAGERLQIVGRVAPLDAARNPGEPSQRSIGVDDGIVGSVAVRRIVARAPPPPFDVRVQIAILRARLSASVRRSLPEPQATILAGALWGERGTLPPDMRDDFTATGTVHVLVTAGLHCGVIAAVCGWLLTLLRVGRIPAALATIPVVYAYALVSGWHVPAQRAATMIAVALIARACGARTVSLNTLALAAIVVAAAWPVAVGSVSFAMSFSCVTAIVLFAPAVTERLAHRLPPFAAHAVALTVATQIGVWPLTAAVFGTLAPYAIVANAIIVPAIGAVLAIALGALALHAVPFATFILLRWDAWLIALVAGTAHLLAHAPGAQAALRPAPPLWSLAIYDAAAIAAAAALRRTPLAAAALLAVGSLQVVFAAHAPSNGGVQIVMLDVGQGDGIVIRTPHGRTILIDTGGRLENGSDVEGESPAERSAARTMIPYLRRQGIESIDLAVLTHPHGDHAGGLAEIVRTLDVGWIADSGQRYGGHAYNDALRDAHARHVPVITPSCNQRWEDDGITFTFLTPCGAPFADGDNDVNENSLVVRVEYGPWRGLFLGDAGFQSEGRLLARGADLRADLLKVGHHGSAYSSSAAFISAVRPRLALISVGRHNLFGHPAPRTLETLRRAGVTVMRTDTCGAITLTIDGRRQAAVTSMLGCATRLLP